MIHGRLTDWDSILGLSACGNPGGTMRAHHQKHKILVLSACGNPGGTMRAHRQKYNNYYAYRTQPGGPPQWFDQGQQSSNGFMEIISLMISLDIIHADKQNNW